LDGGELSRWLLTYLNALDGTKKNGMGEWPNLTEPIFEKMKVDKVPDSVLQKLGPLKNKEYSPDDFVVELNRRFTRDELSQFQNLVLKSSSKGYDDRFAFLVRIEKLKQIPKASVEDKVALAGYELRVGRHDQAISLLTPLTRDRQPNYFVFQTLSHLYADGGDWKEALRYQQEGQFDTEMPTSIKGLTPVQRGWWKKLDSDYVPALYHIHLRDTELRKGKSPAEIDKLFEMEEVLPLFPVPNTKAPQAQIQFVNDAGIYHPGQLAASEKAKLPEDAIPIVQQLLLWFPRDARLYWLMAELYAANGQFKNATTFFD
jgi:tetratricopeptide (TPR) repeat protein